MSSEPLATHLTDMVWRVVTERPGPNEYYVEHNWKGKALWWWVPVERCEHSRLDGHWVEYNMPMQKWCPGAGIGGDDEVDYETHTLMQGGVGGDERTVDLTDIVDQIDHVVIYKEIGGDE